MNKDKLTNRERWEAVIKGEKPDRVPVFAWMHDHIALINGLPNLDTDPATVLRAHEFAQQLYGYDSPPLFLGKFGMGGLMIEKNGQLLPATEKCVETLEDAQNLVIPEDIPHTDTFARVWEFSQLLDKNGYPEITFFFRDPVSTASTLLGLENMMMKLVEDADLVHAVMQKSTDLVLQIINAWHREFGAERLFPISASPLSSNKLISPRHFEKFVLPYEKAVYEHLSDLGVTMGLAHLCSAQSKNLVHWNKIRFPKRIILSFGTEVNLKQAGEALPGYIIAGNNDPLMLRDSKPEEVLAECRRAVEEGKDNPGGFFLMPGCDVPPQAPPVNVYQMVAAARTFGQYDASN